MLSQLRRLTILELFFVFNLMYFNVKASMFSAECYYSEISDKVFYWSISVWFTLPPSLQMSSQLLSPSHVLTQFMNVDHSLCEITALAIKQCIMLSIQGCLIMLISLIILC